MREGWLGAATEVPSEGEIARLYEETLGASREAAHPLEAYEEQIKEWLRAKSTASRSSISFC